MKDPSSEGLSRVCQLDNSLVSALRCVSDALHVWLGVRVLRSAADIDWFIAQAPHLGTLSALVIISSLTHGLVVGPGSSCVTEDTFGGLIDSLRKPLQLIEPSQALTRLWNSSNNLYTTSPSICA